MIYVSKNIFSWKIMNTKVSRWKKNFGFHIADLISVLTFIAILLTYRKLKLITIALKKPASSFCQLVQTQKVEHWIEFIQLSAGYSTVSPMGTYSLHIALYL